MRLGELDQSTDIDCIKIGDTEICGDPHVDIPVENVTPHPNYSKENLQNDIALIKLQRNIRFTGLLSSEI